MNEPATGLPGVRLPARPGLDVLAFALIGVSMGCFAWAWARGQLGLGAYVFLQAPLFFGLVTIDHDAVHGMVHRRRWVNEALGQLSALALGGTLGMHRAQHLEHHRDPLGPGDLERWLVPADRANVRIYALDALLRAAAHPLLRLAHAWRHLPEHRPIALAYVGAVAIAAALAPELVLLGWLLPAWIALTGFWVVGYWLPHGVLGIAVGPARRLRPLLHLLTLFHEDHHRAPDYPFSQWWELYLLREAPELDAAAPWDAPEVQPAG